MIFLYLCLIGLLLCRVISGYDIENVLHIINTGKNGIGRSSIFEIIISFTFYNLSIIRIIKSLEETNILYEYISIRINTKRLLFLRMIKVITKCVIVIMIQKIAAESLIMLFEKTIGFNIEYLFQNLTIASSFILVGLYYILCFYHNNFSNKLAMIIGMLILICIFLNVQNVAIGSLIIPRIKSDLPYMLLCLSIKILLSVLMYLHCKQKSLNFERMNNND